MGIFRDFPYTNFHEMNLDQLIKIVDRLSKEWADFQVDWNNDVAAQVDAWLTAHPEATTTVLDGAISTAKLADGAVTFDKVSNDLLDAVYDNLKVDEINGKIIRKKLLKKSSYSREFIIRKPLSFYTGGDATYVWLQCAEYIDTTNRVVLGFVSSDYQLSMLVECDTYLETVYRRVNGLSLGHCNDMAYNPNTNLLYVATMGTGVYANRLAVVDAASLSIVNSINIGSPVYQVSYDRDNDLFYVGTGNIDIYNSLFQLVKSNPRYDNGSYINKTVTNQGSCVLDGNFILLSQDKEYAYLTTYDYTDGAIEAVQEYTNSSYIDEAEALCYIPNVGVYLLGGQRYVYADILKTKETSSQTEIFDIFANGYEIPDGSDLDDYYQAGKYFSKAAANSGTMFNVPNPCQNRGFTLYVLNHASDWLVQFIMGNSVKNFMLFRTKEATNAWGAWQYLYPHAELLDANAVAVNGTCQIPADNLLHYDAITICMNRNDYSGGVTVTTAQIRAGDCNSGMCIFCAHDKYYEFTISSTGLLTLTAESGLSDPYIRAIYN